MISLKQFETIADKLDSLDENDLMTLLKWFRFDEMLSVSHHDFHHLRLHIKFIAKLMYKDQFFRVKSAIKHTLEFVFINIFTAGKVEHLVEEISQLLHILSYIIKRSIYSNTLKFLIFEQKDRCFEAVAFSSTLANLKYDSVNSCMDILSDLLKNLDCLNNVATRSIIEVFQSFKEMELLRELVAICYLVCERFSGNSEVFNQCVRWFFNTAADFLKTGYNEDTKVAIIKTTNIICSKINNSKDFETQEMLELNDLFKMYKISLLKVSSHILLLSKNKQLRNEALELFCILFSEYSDNTAEVDPETFKKLPEDIDEWHKSGEILFHDVVRFLCQHDKPCWRSEDIIKSISSLLYSRQRFHITKEYMKILCYIYPFVVAECLTRQNLLIGDSLLMLMNYFDLNEIFTLHISQLVWILTRGDIGFKTATLYYWLKYSDKMKEIARAVQHCRALPMLYTFIKNQDLEELVCQRAIDVLQEIGGSQCAIFMSRMLTQTYKQTKTFNKLILAGPSLFERKDDSLKICRFVSVILLTIADEDAFRAACKFINDILTKWKDEKDAFDAFFSDVRIVQFLIKKMKYVSEQTVVVIMDLLKTLLALQKRHSIKTNLKLRIDLDSALMGSEYKMSKGMDIIHVIMNNKETFFEMDDSVIESAAYKLFDACKLEEMESKSLKCLTEMMRANNWLACRSATNMFVELKCTSELNGRSCVDFVTFLSIWLKTLRSMQHQTEIGYVADDGILLNYLERVDTLISFSESTKRKLFRMLKPLAMLRERKFGSRDEFKAYLH